MTKVALKNLCLQLAAKCLDRAEYLYGPARAELKDASEIFERYAAWADTCNRDEVPQILEAVQLLQDEFLPKGRGGYLERKAVFAKTEDQDRALANAPEEESEAPEETVESRLATAAMEQAEEATEERVAALQEEVAHLRKVAAAYRSQIHWVCEGGSPKAVAMRTLILLRKMTPSEAHTGRIADWASIGRWCGYGRANVNKVVNREFLPRFGDTNLTTHQKRRETCAKKTKKTHQRHQL